jgi:EAL domain-containing protein (putative c-di-GMP-specific phosphodiesterase class I)
MKNADRAMYAAKACGRNCWRHYEPCLQKEEYENMILINGLRRALERSEFCLHYQPKMRLVDQKIVGFEALLRWNSAEHGSVPPNRFIPLAEKSSLIVPIGRWILNEACMLARELADRGHGDLHIAVNISPRQLAEADFISSVQGILTCTGIQARQLEIEVTESILIESMGESIEKLKQLRSSGIGIALDDFGTGYSSLTYLRQLPVHTLKVDKSFIDGILEDDTQAELVSYIIDLAHALKLVVVAEGVEDPAQVTLLSQFDCDYIQGYVFSHPEPAGTILTMMERET